MGLRGLMSCHGRMLPALLCTTLPCTWRWLGPSPVRSIATSPKPRPHPLFDQATGALRPTLEALRATLARQAVVGLLLSSGLASAGWVRVYLTAGDPRHASAIALSLLLIVNTSVLVGTVLPFALARLGVDPANAGEAGAGPSGEGIAGERVQILLLMS